MKERNILQATLEAKCPRCRQGNMFEKSAYNLKHMGKMDRTCSQCSLKFEPEPGFYYVAMYVSYAVSVAIFLITVFILYFVAGNPSLETYVISVAAVALILYPLNFRYSRVIALYLFGGVKYDPSKIK